MEASVITTYRCNAKCYMCNSWRYPTKKEEEFKHEILNKLPKLSFCNITGGEPFLREDIEEIIGILRKKARRIVISTNGFFTEKILHVARRYKDIGIRISIEGLPKANDDLRGIKNGFDHGLRTLLELHRMGIKDIGFGITVSDRNAKDMIELYQLAKAMNVEFATAVVHNSYYFHKFDNEITRKEEVINCFVELVHELFKTKKIKNWYRAYFNYGLMRRVKGLPRLLPCEAGVENFFVTPFGEVVPCNGSDEPWVMGNLNYQSWDEIWNSKRAKEVREKVRSCPKNCWMIGTAAPVMKKYILKPTFWVIRYKFLKKKLCF
ncbi:MAG: radical SAM protein [Thermodesulfovibrionales bacterium]